MPDAGIIKQRFWDNKFLLGAFAAGTLLLAAVLAIPPLRPLFQAAPLSPGLLGAAAGLAFGSMAVIQGMKAVRKER